MAVNKDNLPEYQWIIHKYEGHKLENKNGKIFIDGKESNQYTIEQDYYFMMGTTEMLLLMPFLWIRSGTVHRR